MAFFGRDKLRDQLEGPYGDLVESASFLDEDVRDQFKEGLMDLTVGAASLLEAVIVSVTPDSVSGFVDSSLAFEEEDG